MATKLDAKDRKILALLDGDARLSNSQIAKSVQLSKPAVEYRLRRFEKNGIIPGYYTVIDFTKLGYSQYKVYFKFQDTTLEDEQDIIDHWKADKGTAWVAQIRGRWDLAVSILAKSNFEFGQSLSRFMNQFSRFILEKDVLLMEYSSIHTRRYLAETEGREFRYGNQSKVYDLDDTDKRILEVLSNNARMNIVDMAEKTELTRDVINYRVKKMVSGGVIVMYRCDLDLQKLGINLYKIIFRTKNFDGAAEKEVRAYIAQHKRATQFLKLIGSWDLEIEFETENEDELYQILTDLRKKFSGIIRDFDILRITETFKFNFFPF